jgi:hypothetical protein
LELITQQQEDRDKASTSAKTARSRHGSPDIEQASRLLRAALLLLLSSECAPWASAHVSERIAQFGTPSPSQRPPAVRNARETRYFVTVVTDIRHVVGNCLCRVVGWVADSTKKPLQMRMSHCAEHRECARW